MSTFEKIVLVSISFYLAVQLIFLISQLILNWQQEYENKFIVYIVPKQIQYLIHLITFVIAKDDQKIWKKYHAIYYVLMDLYGIILIKVYFQNIWIILSQLLIGLISLSCYIIYQLLFTIFSYLRILLAFQQDLQLGSLLEHYLIPQFSFAIIGIHLLLNYGYSYCGLCYMILRVFQYCLTYWFLQEKGKDNAMYLHYMLDTLMNVYGLLYLNNENICFWLIIGQIALGCLHYCIFILSLILFTISNYYLTLCQYIYFRLNKVVEDSDGWIKKIMILYLIIQLIYSIQIVTEQLKYSQLICLDTIYLFLRIIQYISYLGVQICFNNYENYYYFHFTSYFLMDMYGIYVLLTFSHIYVYIIFQIVYGFILYYWLLVDFISMKSCKYKLLFNILETPFENLLICFLMLEIIFSIIGIKFNLIENQNYLIHRVISYGIILICIKLIDVFKIEDAQRKLQQIMILAIIINYFATFQMLSQGIDYLKTQGALTNLLILTQLFVDLVIIGSFQLIFCQQNTLQNYYLIWLENIKNEQSLKTQNCKCLLWWLKKENVVLNNMDEQCAICQESLLNGSRICKLQCHRFHQFHEGCLNNWESYKNTCPICRVIIRRQIEVVIN